MKGANHAPGGRIGTYNCTLGVAPCGEKRNFLKVTVNSLKQVFAPVTGPSFFNFLAASSSETCMLRTPRLLAFVVKESEFRLNDQLHNMGEVVGAPKSVLNNLVPENDSRIMAKQLVGSSSRNTTGLHCWLLLVMPYRSSQSPTGLRTKGSQFDGARRSAHGEVLGFEARVGVGARCHGQEHASQERGHEGRYALAGAHHVDSKGTACRQTR